LTGASEGFVADVVSKLAAENNGAAADLVYQTYLDSLPYLTARKHFIHRKKTPGYAADAARTYAFNMAHLANQIARMEAQPDFSNALSTMKSEVKARSLERRDSGGNVIREEQFLNEFNKRYEWIMKPGGSKWASTLTGLGFAFHLGLSPAAALINLTQTWIVSLPELASTFGFRASAAALGRAMRESIAARRRWGSRGDYGTWGNLSDDERQAFAHWHDIGAIDVTNTHSLMGMAEQDSAKYAAGMEKAMSLLGLQPPSELIEPVQIGAEIGLPPRGRALAVQAQVQPLAHPAGLSIHQHAHLLARAPPHPGLAQEFGQRQPERSCQLSQHGRLRGEAVIEARFLSPDWLGCQTLVGQREELGREAIEIVDRGLDPRRKTLADALEGVVGPAILLESEIAPSLAHARNDPVLELGVQGAQGERSDLPEAAVELQRAGQPAEAVTIRGGASRLRAASRTRIRSSGIQSLMSRRRARLQ
jgi:hypothetical protein